MSGRAQSQRQQAEKGVEAGRPAPVPTGHGAKGSVDQLPRAAGNRATVARGLGPDQLMVVQRAAGNRAAAGLLGTSRSPVAVQRRRGATPMTFEASGSGKDDVNCKVWSKHTWKSSSDDMGDLSDVRQREKVVFARDPRTDMPAYNHPPPGIQLNGAVLTKIIGGMSSGGSIDTHSGAAETTAFNYGANANLRKAAWTLVGTQHYQYEDDSGQWVDLDPNPYTITRKMEQDDKGQWHLTLTKTGPGVDITAGPTPIYDQVSTLAMNDIATQRVDQTAEWQSELSTLQALGLGLKKDTSETITTPAKKKVAVLYEYTDPVAKPALDDKATYKISSSARKQVKAEAKGAIKMIKAVLDGPNPPGRIVFTLAAGGTSRQQAWWTSEQGGTYRILLRADKLTNLRDHIPSSVPGSAATAEAGTKTKDKDKDKARICAYSRGSAVHELGHMLHAKASPDKFLSAAMVAPLPPITGVDPLRPQKEQIASINSRVMAALLQGYIAQNWAPKWGYALQNSNPAEVTAEVFTALMSAKLTNAAAEVPRALAAVYVAYGGYQGGDLAAKLSAIFGGAIPTLSQPQDCLQHMA